MFLYAAVPKLLDWPGFSEAVARYHMLPDVLTPALSLLLASLELVLGFLLLTGICVRLSAWLTIGLNIMFIIAMGQAMIRGIDISCGCFATSKEPLGFAVIVRDLGFIAMAGLVLWRKNEPS
ncbi:MAG: DoxX family membrane protein [Holophagae bacterium]|nr:DoxX family membrane protein [Holophagae bacterium]